MRKFITFAALFCCAMMTAANYSLQVAGIQVTDANCSDILNDGKVSAADLQALMERVERLEHKADHPKKLGVAGAR